MVAFMAFVSTIAVYVGRMWFKRWFNPLSLYSFAWGFCLALYELRLIQYERVSAMAWLFILVAWGSLYLGALIAKLASPSESQPASGRTNLQRMKWAILALTAIGAVGVLSEMLVLYREFGNVFEAVFYNASDVYLARTDNALAYLPYVGSAFYPAVSLAGCYAAETGSFGLVCMAPFFFMALHNLFGMGRAGLGIGAMLFLVCYLYTPRKPVSVKKKILIGATATAILVGGFFAVSLTRSLQVDFPGRTDAIDSISEYVPIFPSLYSNFSAPPVALSLYLAAPEKQHPWGAYTLAPVLRFVSRLGLPVYVQPYEENYYTPVPMNTSTYVKNIYSDFGMAGIVLLPLILGIASVVLSLKVQGNLVAKLLLANLYVYLAFSVLYSVTVLGDWYIGLIVGVIVGALIDRRRHFFEPMTGLMRNPHTVGS